MGSDALGGIEGLIDGSGRSDLVGCSARLFFWLELVDDEGCLLAGLDELGGTSAESNLEISTSGGSVETFSDFFFHRLIRIEVSDQSSHVLYTFLYYNLIAYRFLNEGRRGCFSLPQ
jgi:hypothetical protein